MPSSLRVPPFRPLPALNLPATRNTCMRRGPRRPPPLLAPPFIFGPRCPRRHRQNARGARQRPAPPRPQTPHQTPQHRPNPGPPWGCSLPRRAAFAPAGPLRDAAPASPSAPMRAASGARAGGVKRGCALGSFLRLSQSVSSTFINLLVLAPDLEGGWRRQTCGVVGSGGARGTALPRDHSPAETTPGDPGCPRPSGNKPRWYCTAPTS